MKSLKELELKADKIAGAILGCRELPAPRRAPELLNAPASNGTGLLICARDAEPPEKCTALYNQNEKMHY